MTNENMVQCTRESSKSGSGGDAGFRPEKLKRFFTSADGKHRENYRQIVKPEMKGWI